MTEAHADDDARPARSSRSRRVVAVAIGAALALGGGAWGFHAWDDSRPPSTSILYVYVVDEEAEPTVDQLLASLLQGSFGLDAAGATSGPWDACRGTGAFASFAPGAAVQFEAEHRATDGRMVAPTTVSDATLRNVTVADLERLESASREANEYLDSLVEAEGVMPSRAPVSRAEDTRAELETLAAGGHACLLVASVPYVDSEFLTVRLPGGMGTGTPTTDSELRDGAGAVFVSSARATP